VPGALSLKKKLSLTPSKSDSLINTETLED